MDWHVAKSALDLMIERSKSFKVQFTGGEPLLNFNLVEQVVNYLNSMGVDVRFQIQTNATLINSETAKKLRALNVAVGVSLDGLPYVNDQLRPFANGQGSTIKALNGIKKLGDFGIKTGLTSVLSAANVKGLPSLVEMASYLGNVYGISIDPLRKIGRGIGEMEANPETAAHYLDLAIRRADEIVDMGGLGVKFREIERMKHLLSTGNARKYRCYVDACQSLLVTPSGNAYPCASLCYPDFHLGHIEDEYFGHLLQKGLKFKGDIIASPDRCRDCSEKWLCGGACPAQIFSTSGEIELECAIKKVFMKHARRDHEVD